MADPRACPVQQHAAAVHFDDDAIAADLRDAAAIALTVLLISGYWLWLYPRSRG